MLITIFLVSALCFVFERLRPCWRLPAVRTWPLRVLLANAAQLGVVLLAGISWERWLASASLLRVSDALPPAAAGLLAYFIATFVFYWWHRWHRRRHESNLLWHCFHQIITARSGWS